MTFILRMLFIWVPLYVTISLLILKHDLEKLLGKTASKS